MTDTRACKNDETQNFLPSIKIFFKILEQNQTHFEKQENIGTFQKIEIDTDQIMTV